MDKANTISGYITSLQEDVGSRVTTVYSLIKRILPDATEAISYGIPAFMLNRSYVVYFAGYKEHVSLYPIPNASKELTESIGKYKKGKGTLQFPNKEPLPIELIEDCVKELLRENIARSLTKKTKSAAEK